MKLAKDYNSVMGRSAEIMKASLGLDFNDFESGSVAFDYEGLMKATGYTIEEVDKIQSKTGVGHTQLLELRNITKLANALGVEIYELFVDDAIKSNEQLLKEIMSDIDKISNNNQKLLILKASINSIL